MTKDSNGKDGDFVERSEMKTLSLHCHNSTNTVKNITNFMT